MSSIDGLYGRSSSRFLKRLHTAFNSGCTSLHSHQQCMRFPYSPISSQTFVGVGVLDGSYSNRSEMNFSVVFDFHFLYGW
jgi:hypothetical protein